VKIALYDVDSVMPNLALMKVSAYHKSLGHEVVPFDPLFTRTYDKIYASKVFKDTDGSLLDPDVMEIGGTGWDVKATLPDEIEAMQPDYTFYGYPHNIGFAMRGCRFRCKFCVVPEKEGQPFGVQTIDEIWQQRGSNFIVLLDNDFFGNPAWADRIAEIRQHKLRVNFSQGLNIRLITQEQADAVASVKFYNLTNKYRQVHFAWDQFSAGTERLIDQGIDRCFQAGIKAWQMAFYVLIGFNTSHEEDLYRVIKLRDLGCDPYVMPFDKSDLYQKNFARYVNHRAVFHSIEWPEYVKNLRKKDPIEGQAEMAL
jgi:hypothetical protein